MTQTLMLGIASECFAAAAERFDAAGGTRRLWDSDASLWTGADEADWLGWLDLTDPSPSDLAALDELARAARREQIQQIVVMGMGGSSLCPDLLARSFEPAAGCPRVRVLDSTVPAQVAAIEQQIDWPATWFVVSSKSGGTIEPNSFLAYFFALARDHLGDAASSHFVAITDPGSSLEARAHELGFRAVVAGIPSVGGRFSALSAFGLLPAALQGIDLADWLGRAGALARACGPDVAVSDNPGAQLGLAMGALASAGRDKLVLALSPGIAAFGGWIEQLVAESTGKAGRGVTPIDGGTLPTPQAAGSDKLFVYIRLGSAPDPSQEDAIAALAAAGQPVVRIDVAESLDLAGELFRWEFATAVASAVLGVNPFDQPDVESAKREARELMAAYERDGCLPEASPLLRDDGLALFADPGLALPADLDRAIADHFARTVAGDYVALNAYLPMDDATRLVLESLRRVLSTQLHVPTTLGFGPRFLHSTGQLHKGGANNGVFLQLTADDPFDLPVPDQHYSFAVLKQAQARGDFAVLCERGRRALHLHLPADDPAALLDLVHRVERTLAMRRERPLSNPTTGEEPTPS